MTQPLAGAFQQPFGVRQHRSLIEAEIDVAAHGHDVGVAVGHLLRPDAEGGGVVAEPHGLDRVHVDGPDYGSQASRDGSEVGIDTREQLVEGALRRLGQFGHWIAFTSVDLPGGIICERRRKFLERQTAEG